MENNKIGKIAQEYFEKKKKKKFKKIFYNYNLKNIYNYKFKEIFYNYKFKKY